MVQTSSETLFPDYSLGERRMDQAVHLVGVSWALVAVPLLLIAVDPWGDAAMLIGWMLYSLGLLWMWCMSAAYNSAQAPGLKRVLRRLDHSGIFVMIAGSYSPFALVKIGGALGIGVFAFVWSLALIGVFLSLRFPHRADRASLLLSLAMGWSVLLILQPLIEAVSTSVLVLLVVGGILFTGGIAFHLARNLRFHNAIWHLFVLAAAVNHYIAIFLALRSA